SRPDCRASGASRRQGPVRPCRAADIDEMPAATVGTSIMVAAQPSCPLSPELIHAPGDGGPGASPRHPDRRTPPIVIPDERSEVGSREGSASLLPEIPP